MRQRSTGSAQRQDSELTEKHPTGTPEKKPSEEFERLAVTLAHEMRNSLSTILSAVSQIRNHSRTKSEEEDTLLRAAEEEVIHLNETVGGVLDFARPSPARVLECRPVEIARDAIERLTHNRGLPKGVKLSVEALDEDLSTALDPKMFAKAIEHLLTNSLESMDRENGSITVKIDPISGSGTGVAVQVLDNGCGFPDDIRDMIFEPFFSTKSSSLGLGLTLVQQMAQAHKGTIQLESEPGKGTAARLLIPSCKTD